MPLSLYLHIPFCSTRCSYCDFNTYAGIEDRIPAYVDALLAEVRAVAAGLRGADAPTEVHTIFFGGGTPSLLPSVSLRALMVALREEFEIAPEVEVTLEANPGTVTPRTLESLARLGINRLSLGGQSANPAELALLGRTHSFADVGQSVRAAREAGFADINVDWILGLPHQTFASWLTTLERAIELRTEHLSVYSLSLEHGTPMRAWVMRGLVSDPDPDRAADMYEATVERLRRAGFVQYEISNWARPRPGAPPGAPVEAATFACRHNLQYWRNLPYLGFGAGAHGCALGWRYSNVLSPDGYIRALSRVRASTPPMGPAVATAIRSSPSDSMSETMFLGLRLTGEGVAEDGFSRRFARSMNTVYGAELRRLAGEGLIEWTPDRVRLTARGRLLGNRVFEAFV